MKLCTLCGLPLPNPRYAVATDSVCELCLDDLIAAEKERAAQTLEDAERIREENAESKNFLPRDSGFPCPATKM